MSKILIAILMAFILAAGIILDRREEAAARAFMSRCIKDNSFHDCLVLWGGDTDVFEGEAM